MSIEDVRKIAVPVMRHRISTNFQAQAEGITAEFNRNVLRRLNEDGLSRFDLDLFDHKSIWNDEMSRIEMHLVSKVDQRVSVNGHAIDLLRGETIHTECSYKYGPEGVAGITDRFRLTHSWTDAQRMFSVQYLVVTDPPA